jgi:hypothetical protein
MPDAHNEKAASKWFLANQFGRLRCHALSAEKQLRWVARRWAALLRSKADYPIRPIAGKDFLQCNKCSKGDLRL